MAANTNNPYEDMIDGRPIPMSDEQRRAVDKQNEDFKAKQAVKLNPNKETN